eukprot:scaffold2740_cov418-Prasinococcus_capsulatus_cf.AAC.8
MLVHTQSKQLKDDKRLVRWQFLKQKFSSTHMRKMARAEARKATKQLASAQENNAMNKVRTLLDRYDRGDWGI